MQRIHSENKFIQQMLNGDDNYSPTVAQRLTRQDSASIDLLELCRLIILDKMIGCPDTNDDIAGQLHAFGTLLSSLESCREAQGDMVHVLLRQIPFMIDSTARQLGSSEQTTTSSISSPDNRSQFQLLLTNSICISQVVTDKLWSSELYADNFDRILITIDHQLLLTEQILKYNELLPKQNPPYAINMQRVLNRTLLFALSRPMQHMSDQVSMLDLLKKIYDNRILIILNHLHSCHSAEFFVCLTYRLLVIIDENSTNCKNPDHQSVNASGGGKSQSIGRQLSEPNRDSAKRLSSFVLMLISMARKVWDSIYKSKKGLLSEAFDVPLSLPAFTLETSPDLLELKPHIIDTCRKFWANLVESERKGRGKKLQHGQTITGTTTASLSDGFTKFVSRVVGGKTASPRTSNDNLAGKKVAKNKTTTRSASTNQMTDEVDTFCEDVPFRADDIQQQLSPHQPFRSQMPNSKSLSVDQSSLFNYPTAANYQQQQQLRDSNQPRSFSASDYYSATQEYHELTEPTSSSDIKSIVVRSSSQRALFGPDCGSRLEKWCLDMTEGPKRMRKKLIDNTRQFYDNYPYQPKEFNPDNKSPRLRTPVSYDSFLYYIKSLKIDTKALNLGSIDKENIDEEGIREISKALASKQLTVQDSTASFMSSQDKQARPVSATSFSIDIESPSPRQEDLTSSSTGRTSITPAEFELQLKRANFQQSTSPTIESRTSPSNFHSIDRRSPNSPRLGDYDLSGDSDGTSFVDFSNEMRSPEVSNPPNCDADIINSSLVLPPLEQNEQISHIFRCCRIQGLDTYEGLLLFGREHFYLIDGFTLMRTREIKAIDTLPPDTHDPIIPHSTPNLMAHEKKACNKFSYDTIVEVHKRRYLFQPIALEVFLSGGRSNFIVFPRNIRSKVYGRFMAVSTQLTLNANESLTGQKPNVSVEGGSGLLSNLIGETSVTHRWVRGEMSNFQYLMHLNTIAGRSYNDLMQYPIFPWILNDYSSDHLDLSKPSTFRDLSRPVGAQTSERLKQFERRFKDWDDNETPPYHYGTFYSSSMIVSFYMVRMEPFTQHFLRLQGGHFDLPDRMFHSIQDTWLSVSKHNMADVKELIPEFFYLPEFLKNENKYDLGVKQNGMRLDDVILPPWAKNDAREFIRLHRCALESDYVSSHLHEWIDLIFGYKQQGQAAIQAVNVFHHLFYEGNVDIYNTDIDPIRKNAFIGFINNFGQVPRQLFKKPHPARKVTNTTKYLNIPSSPISLKPILPSIFTKQPSLTSNQILQPQIITACPQYLRQTASPQNVKSLNGPVGQIIEFDRSVLAVEQNKLLIPPEYCRYVAWGHGLQDRGLRLSLYDSEKPIFAWTKDGSEPETEESLTSDEIFLCTIPNSRTMITASRGPALTVWKIEKVRSFSPILNLNGHLEQVTSLTSSQAYSLILSGSRDRRAIIWDLNRLTFVRHLGGGSQDELVHQGPISAIAINELSGDIATCASSWLYLWSINGDLLAHIDTYVATMQHTMSSTVDVDGGLESDANSQRGTVQLLSACFSQFTDWEMNEVIITSGSDGSVALWSMRFYQCPMSEAEIEEANAKAAEMNALAVANQEACGDQQPSQQQHPKEDPTQTREMASELPAFQGSIRSRTNTMDSEWVRLSVSSSASSGAYTSPMQQSTPTNESTMGGYSFIEGFTSPMSEKQQLQDCKTSPATSSSQQKLDTSSLDPPHHPSGCAGGEKSMPSNSLVESFVLLDESPNIRVTNEHPLNSPELRRQQVTTQKSTPITIVTPSSSQAAKARRRLHNSKDHKTNSRSERRLRPNHKWKRELYLRALLPRRSGDFITSPVTALAISRDHKILYMGESSGLITCWSTN